jgi:hypothetical protein
MVQFIDLLAHIREISLEPYQALYLIWNEDLSGNSAPPDREIFDLARTLRAGMAAIESEFALADDPDGSIARAKMAMIYGNEAAEFFFGLLDNTSVTTVSTARPSSLEQAILEVAPGRISYDEFRKRLFLPACCPSLRRAKGMLESKTTSRKLWTDSIPRTRKLPGLFRPLPGLLPCILHSSFLAN